nr:uncharacterized protein LOC109773800 [Aegilops tauschii subsp. strangulata]
MYDRDNPSIEEGVVFSSTVECRNAVATFSIKSETEYMTLKSDPRRFTVKCACDRCKWRLHASLMRRSTLFQIKVNPYPHNCPSVNRSQILRALKRRWIADASVTCIRNNPGIGPKQIQQRLAEKYGIEVPYSRCYFGKELAVDKTFGKYSESFSLLYSSKAEVERTSPGSVVEIDKHTVEYTLQSQVSTWELCKVAMQKIDNTLFVLLITMDESGSGFRIVDFESRGFFEHVQRKLDKAEVRDGRMGE